MVDYNPTLAEAVFVFTPPEGATEIDNPTPIQFSLTLEEAREQVDFPVLAIPDEAMADADLDLALEDIQVMIPSEESNGDGYAPTTVSLIYFNDTEMIQVMHIAQEPYLPAGPALADTPGVDVIDIRGYEGIVNTDAPSFTTVMWEENGVQMMVMSTVEREQLLPLLESMEE